MKQQMRLMVSDAPVQDVKMALAKEFHERDATIRALIARRQIAVVNDNCATHVTVRIDTEFFTDIREQFPTTQLLARVQLALAAGLSDKNFSGHTTVDHAVDAMQYAYREFANGIGKRTVPRGVGKSELLGMGYRYEEGAYDEVAPVAPAARAPKRVTATVKYRKGLRP